MKPQGCLNANYKSKLIILLSTELVRIIVNTGATTTLLNHKFLSIFDEFFLKLWHTTQKFKLCVTILSKIHQKIPENHDFRGVVVAPVFTIIRMSSVIDNITTLDSGFVCRHPHGSILVFFELCVTILSTTFHTPRIFKCSISKITKQISKNLDVLESWRCLLYMLAFSDIKFKYWRSYIRFQKKIFFLQN